MSKNALIPIDQLAFFRTGNRVNKIIDDSGNSTGFSGTSTYDYDAAGRMTSDSQKGTVAYNHLGLVLIFNGQIGSSVFTKCMFSCRESTHIKIRKNQIINIFDSSS